MALVPAGKTWRAFRPHFTGSKPPQRCVARLNASPRCGARTRRGDACRAPAVGGKARCRMHGGARGSGGQPGNRNAWKHGLYDRAAKAENRRHQARLRAARSLLRDLERDSGARRRGVGRAAGQVPRDRAPSLPFGTAGVHGLVCQVPPGEVPGTKKDSPERHKETTEDSFCFARNPHGSSIGFSVSSVPLWWNRLFSPPVAGWRTAGSMLALGRDGRRAVTQAGDGVAADGRKLLAAALLAASRHPGGENVP